MSEFKVIETQEQLNTVIADRLKRERETTEKRFEGYLSPEDVEKKYKGFMSPEAVEEKYKGFLSPDEAAEKDKKIKKYETDSVKSRIARENNIPEGLISRLRGESEEEIRKDAEDLSKLLGSKNTPPAASEPAGNNKKEAHEAAYTKLLEGIKGE